MTDNDKPEGSVAYLLGEIRAEQKAMNEKLDKALKSDEGFDERLSSLEKDRAKTLGAAGVVSALIAACWAWFTSK